MKFLLRSLLLLVLLLSTTHAAPPAPPAPNGSIRFLPVDILLDSHQARLASYQVEITARDASIVGLEGGDPRPFRDAPFYDPAALQGPAHRIILAAFSTAAPAELPTGKTRIARLHLSLEQAAAAPPPTPLQPDIASKLVVATDAQGQPIQAQLELRFPQAPQGEKP